jgi:hypothetical protein
MSLAKKIYPYLKKKLLPHKKNVLHRKKKVRYRRNRILHIYPDSLKNARFETKKKSNFFRLNVNIIQYRPASIRARAILSLDRVAGVSRIKHPPMHNCARFFFFLLSQSLL